MNDIAPDLAEDDIIEVKLQEFEEGQYLHLVNIFNDFATHTGVRYEVRMMTATVSTLHDFRFRIESNDNITIIGRNTTATEITIPSEINGRAVTEIGDHAFLDSDITSVIIPDTVTRLGFSAFRNTNITEVIIPNSVTRLDMNAFRDNELLTSVTFEDGTQITKIEPWVFENTAITEIEIPNTVTKIGMGAFANSALTRIVLPDSVTTIDTEAFANSALVEIFIPNTVQIIHYHAFQGLSEEFTMYTQFEQRPSGWFFSENINIVFDSQRI